jgi:2-oxoglutarate ferredoxin oxidoreductase subunit delta
MEYQYCIEIGLCKGCGLCVSVCPKSVLEIDKKVNTKGYFPAFQARPKDCVKCAICCNICPDVAISITQTAEME